MGGQEQQVGGKWEVLKGEMGNERQRREKGQQEDRKKRKR